MICGCQDQEPAQEQGEPDIGLVKGWGNEGKHQGVKKDEDGPVESSEIKHNGH